MATSEGKAILRKCWYEIAEKDADIEQYITIYFLYIRIKAPR